MDDGNLPVEPDEEVLGDEPKFDGPDYKTVEWWEETSMYDTNPTTRWAGDYCQAKYRRRVPGHLKEEEIDDWINENIDFIKWLDPT